MGKLILKDEVAVAHTMCVASEAYDYLYLKGQQLFAEYDPCAVRDGACRNGRQNDGNSFCCFGCKHLSEDGCTIRSLSCKLWLCGGFNIPSEFKTRIHELYDMAHHGWSKELLWTGGDEPTLYDDTPSLTGGVRGSKDKHMEYILDILLHTHITHDVKLILPWIEPMDKHRFRYMQEDDAAFINADKPRHFFADSLCRRKVWAYN